MLESMYWQSPKGADYLQFLCDISYRDDGCYLENEITSYYGVITIGRTFAYLSLSSSEIDWNYRHLCDYDFFIYHVGLEED